MHRRRRVVPVALVLAMLTAACKGGSDEAGGTTTMTPPVTTPPTTTPSTTTPGQVTTTSTTPGTDPALVAKARAATLQKGDFPTGFDNQVEEPGQGLNVDLVWKETLQCLGVPTAPPLGVGTSRTILRGLATQGRSTVEYTTEAAATAATTALAAPTSIDCLTKAFVADVDRSKPEGAKPGPVKVTARDVVAPAGQKALSWRINASVMLDELVVPLFQDFTVVYNRGTIIRLMFLNPGSEFPQDLERTLVDKVVARA